MKNFFKVIYLILFQLFIYSCKKEDKRPVVITTSVTEITQVTALSGGNLMTDNGEAITAKGVCWSAVQDPTISDNKTSDGNGLGTYTSLIKGLTPNTSYNLRAYATTNVGTVYGKSISFITLNDPIIFNPSLNYGTLVDIEGNIYKTVKIGTQIWMAENLKSTKFKDGTTIPNVTEPFLTTNWDWYNLKTPAYCWYQNDPIANKYIYGALYNGYSIVTGNLCPTGWHLPSNAEWTTLSDYLGGITTSGGKLKESGTIIWTSPNFGATNESGFTALPGGGRVNVSFGQIGQTSYFWSTSESNYNGLDALYNWVLTKDDGMLYKSLSTKELGFSVRCIKD
jgi:uncharacterized protein (TIGR02145 family)